MNVLVAAGLLLLASAAVAHGRLVLAATLLVCALAELAYGGRRQA